MTPPKTVAFYTLGCKLNFSETSAIARQFTEAGYVKAPFEQGADVYVINTCSVTENADRECRQIIRRALRQTPESQVIVIGCYAQLHPEDIASIPGVSLVLGTAEKFDIIEHLHKTGVQPHVEVSPIQEVNFYVHAHAVGDRTRAFLKVQDGCDYNCTFCTIPLARGRSRSPQISTLVDQARTLAATGVKEIVLTGVNIGDFGKGPYGGNKRKENLLALLKALDKIEGIARFRISSIEPNLLHEDIIGFVAESKRFAPHFHIPLQSGSNDILKAMRRRYLRELYAERVHLIKQIMPHCCIGVDVITGFPGETPSHYMETFTFLNELDIAYLHVFTYSERPDTIAATMHNPVPISERKKRTAQLRNLSAKKKMHFYQLHLGQTRPVLFESENQDGFMYGFTDNYIRVRHTFDIGMTNKIIPWKLKSIHSRGEMLGQPADSTLAVSTVN
ncbi:MAG: tRNA (N(6)-L-threonylcarbamoyladenosine(37)-C(2))-methylthiotransferase MtaB [Chitinophagales bacterium]|nr:MAG: tRNA (N(6)-L-threonylcarbamoyladenosine(37)-C(2))-methylthiotransferase MtaB [Chitinophagales bacterium]